jgi:hypothetical protein
MTEEEANNLLVSPDADAFAKALDLFGWQIVPQDRRSNMRWQLNAPAEDCPPWADNGEPAPLEASEGKARIADQDAPPAP